MLVSRGSYREGKSYENRAILEVSGGPNPSPFSKAWDPHSINRFIVAPNHLERQLDAYERTPAKRFISDGDPRMVSYPDSLEARLARDRLDARTPRSILASGGAM